MSEVIKKALTDKSARSTDVLRDKAMASGAEFAPWQ